MSFKMVAKTRTVTLTPAKRAALKAAMEAINGVPVDDADVPTTEVEHYSDRVAMTVEEIAEHEETMAPVRAAREANEASETSRTQQVQNALTILENGTATVAEMRVILARLIRFVRAEAKRD
jgi:hypothetical protein